MSLILAIAPKDGAWFAEPVTKLMPQKRLRRLWQITQLTATPVLQIRKGIGRDDQTVVNNSRATTGPVAAVLGSLGFTTPFRLLWMAPFCQHQHQQWFLCAWLSWSNGCRDLFRRLLGHRERDHSRLQEWGVWGNWWQLPCGCRRGCWCQASPKLAQNQFRGASVGACNRAMRSQRLSRSVKPHRTQRHCTITRGLNRSVV